MKRQAAGWDGPMASAAQAWRRDLCRESRAASPAETSGSKKPERKTAAGEKERWKGAGALNSKSNEAASPERKYERTDLKICHHAGEMKRQSAALKLFSKRKCLGERRYKEEAYVSVVVGDGGDGRRSLDSSTKNMKCRRAGVTRKSPPICKASEMLF